MSNYGSPDLKLLVDGYDLTADTTEFTDEGVEPIFDRRTAFGDSWERQIPTGMNRALGLSQNAFFDDATHGSLEAVLNGQGLSRIVSYSLAGNVLGRRFVGWRGALQTKSNRLTKLEAFHRLGVTYLGNGEQEEGRIVQPHGQIAANGNTQATPVDLGAPAAITSLTSVGLLATAVSAGHGYVSGMHVTVAGATQAPYNGTYQVTVVDQDTFTYAFAGSGTSPATGTITVSSGLAGYAHLTELTGITSLQLKVRHSPDAVTWADLVTFAPFTATGAQRVNAQTTVQRYLAASWALTGAGTATFLIGGARSY